jgi:transcriptional regulator with XRE-family HTH domain
MSVKTTNWLTEDMTAEQTAQARLCACVLMYLQDYRREHGMTQQQLAELLGVSQGMVSRWENAEENLTIGTLVKIATATGATVNLSFDPAREDYKKVLKKNSLFAR